MIFVLCEHLGVGFCLCAVQEQFRKILVYGVASKHCYKAQENSLILLLQRDCKKIPSWLLANSKAGTIEGRYEFLWSSELHLRNVFNVPVIVFDSLHLLQLYMD